MYLVTDDLVHRYESQLSAEEDGGIPDLSCAPHQKGRSRTRPRFLLDFEVPIDVDQHTSQVFLAEFSGPRILSVGEQRTAVDEGDLDYARAAARLLRARAS